MYCKQEQVKFEREASSSAACSASYARDLFDEFRWLGDDRSGARVAGRSARAAGSSGGGSVPGRPSRAHVRLAALARVVLCRSECSMWTAESARGETPAHLCAR
ncbi:unnamed protein product [Euphydryas editha]|uniref:Uncharacterized protein n=1 Tax=Euphydryas editha TaxID=104508 RepID=A0AAU9TKH4_EUPED|nr:unnamed protein product [Euphydryas editha]